MIVVDPNLCPATAPDSRPCRPEVVDHLDGDAASNNDPDNLRVVRRPCCGVCECGHLHHDHGYVGDSCSKVGCDCSEYAAARHIPLSQEGAEK